MYSAMGGGMRHLKLIPDFGKPTYVAIAHTYV